MPRNYRNIDRDERVERLAAIATEQFLTVGYAKTTMAEIARVAGLTSGSIYWYFQSKDDALAAVHERVLASTREQLRATAGLTPMGRLQAYLEIMRNDARPLHRMLHERTPFSSSVTDALDEIHRELEAMIQAVVLDRCPDYAETTEVVELAMTVIEGTSAINAAAHSSDIVRWAIEHLVPVQREPRGASAAPQTRPRRKLTSARPPTSPSRTANGKGPAPAG